MFNSPVLDLVILLSFTYFIFSLISSAINVAIAGALRLRQKELEKGIYRFLFDADWPGFVKNHLLNSPHIQTLMRQKNRIPAYIPARNFISALLDNESELPSKAKELIASIRRQIEPMTDANEKLAAFQARMEEEFNNSMERVSGWYKKRIRKILLAIGLVLTIGLNIDTIKIANDALKDPGKLNKAVDNISANMPRFDSLNNLVVKASTDTVRAFDLRSTTDTLKKLTVIYEKTSGFAIGYKDFNDFLDQWRQHFLKKFFGAILTVFALQLGANYWFELMTKAVNIRAVGKKPDDKSRENKPAT